MLKRQSSCEWHNLGLITAKAYDMKQLDVPDEKKVDINFESKELPEAARVLMPLVFRDGDSYCCVLGPDPHEGVFGSGKTPMNALKDWDRNLQKRKKIQNPEYWSTAASSISNNTLFAIKKLF